MTRPARHSGARWMITTVIGESAHDVWRSPTAQVTVDPARTSCSMSSSPATRPLPDTTWNTCSRPAGCFGSDAPASRTATSTRTRSADIPGVSRLIATPDTPSRDVGGCSSRRMFNTVAGSSVRGPESRSCLRNERTMACAGRPEEFIGPGRCGARGSGSCAPPHASPASTLGIRSAAVRAPAGEGALSRKPRAPSTGRLRSPMYFLAGDTGGQGAGAGWVPSERRGRGGRGSRVPPGRSARPDGSRAARVGLSRGCGPGCSSGWRLTRGCHPGLRRGPLG